MKGISPKQRDKIKKIIYGSVALGIFLVLIVICLIVRSCKKNSMDIEHRSLMNDE